MTVTARDGGVVLDGLPVAGDRSEHHLDAKGIPEVVN